MWTTDQRLSCGRVIAIVWLLALAACNVSGGANPPATPVAVEERVSGGPEDPVQDVESTPPLPPFAIVSNALPAISEDGSVVAYATVETLGERTNGESELRWTVSWLEVASGEVLHVLQFNPSTNNASAIAPFVERQEEGRFTPLQRLEGEGERTTKWGNLVSTAFVDSTIHVEQRGRTVLVRRSGRVVARHHNPPQRSRWHGGRMVPALTEVYIDPAKRFLLLRLGACDSHDCGIHHRYHFVEL